MTNYAHTMCDQKITIIFKFREVHFAFYQQRKSSIRNSQNLKITVIFLSHPICTVKILMYVHFLPAAFYQIKKDVVALFKASRMFEKYVCYCNVDFNF